MTKPPKIKFITRTPFNTRLSFFCGNLLGTLIILVLALFCGAVAHAQQPAKVPRIGYLSAIELAGEAEAVEAIRRALRALGHIEGQNIATEYRYAEGKLDRFAMLADELVHLKVDVIVAAGGNLLIRAVKNATKTIPIVMIGVPADPVEAGLVESLARPGRNITGITLLSRELAGKRLELLKEAVPKIARVAILYDPTLPGSAREVKVLLPVAARALGLTIKRWAIRDADGFEKIFAALSKERPDGLYVPGGGALINPHINRVAAFALTSRLPSVYPRREAVDAGGLMSYGANRADNYGRVAVYVDKILKGAKPADLPIEQPTKFELVINLKTAKQIGVTIPPNVLARADRVIR